MLDHLFPLKWEQFSENRTLCLSECRKWIELFIVKHWRCVFSCFSHRHETKKWIEVGAKWKHLFFGTPLRAHYCCDCGGLIEWNCQSWNMKHCACKHKFTGLSLWIKLQQGAVCQALQTQMAVCKEKKRAWVIWTHNFTHSVSDCKTDM